MQSHLPSFKVFISKAADPSENIVIGVHILMSIIEYCWRDGLRCKARLHHLARRLCAILCHTPGERHIRPSGGPSRQVGLFSHAASVSTSISVPPALIMAQPGLRHMPATPQVLGSADATLLPELQDRRRARPHARAGHLRLWRAQARRCQGTCLLPHIAPSQQVPGTMMPPAGPSAVL